MSIESRKSGCLGEFEPASLRLTVFRQPSPMCHFVFSRGELFAIVSDRPPIVWRCSTFRVNRCQPAIRASNPRSTWWLRRGGQVVRVSARMLKGTPRLSRQAAPSTTSAGNEADVLGRHAPESRVARRILRTPDVHFGAQRRPNKNSRPTRYSPAECIRLETKIISGTPDPKHISTS